MMLLKPQGDRMPILMWRSKQVEDSIQHPSYRLKESQAQEQREHSGSW